MKHLLILFIFYLLFLLWHQPWLSRRLKPGEAGALLDGRYAEMPPEEASAFKSFMDQDDGKPFYMVNLMQYRERAVYRDASQPGGTRVEAISGREAGRLYGRMVLRELLKRGCYPVLVSRKLSNFLSAGDSADFFEDVAVVRYRSRRDMLAMVASPAFFKGVLHKWASLEKTVAVPTRLLFMLDLQIVVPVLLLAAFLLMRFFTTTNGLTTP
jgi:hypothetical protein